MRAEANLDAAKNAGLKPGDRDYDRAQASFNTARQAELDATNKNEQAGGYKGHR